MKIALVYINNEEITIRRMIKTVVANFAVLEKRLIEREEDIRYIWWFRYIKDKKMEV